METFNHAAASGKHSEASLFKIAHAAADKVSRRKRGARRVAPIPKAAASGLARLAPPPAPTAPMDSRSELRAYLNKPGF